MGRAAKEPKVLTCFIQDMFLIKKHTNMRHLLSACVCGLLTSLTAWGVPATRDTIRFVQPDGNTVNIIIAGDEYSHLVRTIDGYALTTGDKGDYTYAVLGRDNIPVSSGIPARDPERRNKATQSFLDRLDKETIAAAMLQRHQAKTEKHRTSLTSETPERVGLFPDATFPTTGSPRAVVILVEYADVKFTVQNPGKYFDGLLNSTDFSEYGATGSAKDWFTENSGGRFTPQFDVYGPVTLSGKQSYYGGNNAYGNDTAPHKMATEACSILDDAVDFSQYDTDHDGYIDNVFIFYAGVGENRTGEQNAVWPHTSWVTQLDYMKHTYDGVTLDRYACTNELVGTQPDGIGTFCHEFSHVMGLPDLYHTSAGSMPYTPGPWSVLDYGPYLNNGHTPPLYSSFERLALGWMEPDNLIDNLTHVLPPLSGNMAFSATKADGNEFFLFENRQLSGWDRFLPAAGMLVWHVDYNPQIWLDRSVNNDENHQHVDLLEADNIRSELTRDGDIFPGVAGQTDFAFSTVPSFSFHDSSDPGLSISNITLRPGGNINFRTGTGSPRPADVPEIRVEQIGSEEVSLCWEEVSGVPGYIMRICLGDGILQEEHEIPGECRFTAKGLSPETEYIFEIYAYDGLEDSENPASVRVTTDVPEIDYYKCRISDVSDIRHDSFSLSWESIPLANGYIIDVSKLEPGEPETVTIDFSEGLDNLPAGWETSSRLTYANGAYSGESPMSLRLSTDKDYITSGDTGDCIYNLRFWHRGAGTGTEDKIIVMALCDDKWEEINSVPITTNQGGYALETDLSATGCTGLKILFHRESSKGSVAIDDIVMSAAGDRYPREMPEWAGRNIGDSTQTTVDGLEPDSEYLVTLRATDGTKYSQQSDPAHVKTAGLSGIRQNYTGLEEDISHDLLGRPVKDSYGGHGVTITTKTDGTVCKRIARGKK